mmetsp:Transcript_19347/g.48340  ORF Transcript_19347/g.48340 Transcript_19347/m.48340 type:complete len:238 (+) Transcript_19347:428-1141(+)
MPARPPPKQQRPSETTVNWMAPPSSQPRGPERLSAKDWDEIELENQRAKGMLGGPASAGPAGTGLLDKALSSDAMLTFGIDGCVPEAVNGRVAMLGFTSALLVEVATGRSFTTQLVYNLTHGVSITIAATIIIATLAPSFMAGVVPPKDPSSPAPVPFKGEGLTKWRPNLRSRGGREYLCDPRSVDCKGLPGLDTPVGRLGFAPLAEVWNGRAAMIGLIFTFVIEGATHKGLFNNLS